MLNLFKPGKIGNLQIKNRIAMAAMGIRGLFELDGSFSQRTIDYYVARAAGGVGLIITGVAYVDVEVEPHLVGSFSHSAPRADSPVYLSRLEELANAVHAYGAKIAIQLTAGRGRIAAAGDAEAGRAVGPSPLSCFWSPEAKTRELTVEQIKTLIKDFRVAAGIVKAAGMDAIEVHGHEGYLIDQFVTPLWNKRTDRYGGDIEGRLRFPLEIIESIRTEVGPEFPIIYKLGASHHLEGGRDVQESCEIARRLEKAGVNAFDIDAGCYETWHWAHLPTYMPPGPFLDEIEAIKRTVTIPVIAVGKLGYPQIAEEALRGGKADFIALGRQLLADPDWPNKVREGKIDDIRWCLGCLEGCLRRILEGKYLSCTVNPATGMEKELTINPARKKKTVLVVGGGPAGMEVARIAALRGHEVSLWEKGDRLGGNLIPAGIPDFKKDYRSFLDYLICQVEKLGVKIELMREATPELIKELAPDEVIVATGAVPLIPEIKGISDSKVITAVEALLAKRDIGGNIIVIGGGEVGCEAAVWLAKRGKRVTVVEILGDIARDMFLASRMMLLKMLDEGGVKVLTNAKVSEITDKGVVIHKNSDMQLLKADTVVLAVGRKSERKLLEELEGILPALQIVGDCVKPRKIMAAIWEAYGVARLI